MPLPRDPSSAAVPAGTACLSPGTTPAYGDRVGCHPDTSISPCSPRSRSRLGATHHRRDRGAATATTHNQDRSRSATDGCPAPLSTWPVVSLDSVAPERVGQGTTSQQGRPRSPRLRSTNFVHAARAPRPAANVGSRAARGEGAMPLPRPLSSGVVPAGTACTSRGAWPSCGGQARCHPDTPRSRLLRFDQRLGTTSPRRGRAVGRCHRGATAIRLSITTTADLIEPRA